LNFSIPSTAPDAGRPPTAGNAIAYHGGDINGFHSQVSLMPYDGIGAVVLVIGDHPAPFTTSSLTTFTSGYSAWADPME